MAESNEHQDPSEQYRTDVAVETTQQAPVEEPAPTTETKVETTVTETPVQPDNASDS